MGFLYFQWQVFLHHLNQLWRRTKSKVCFFFILYIYYWNSNEGTGGRKVPFQTSYNRFSLLDQERVEELLISPFNREKSEGYEEGNLHGNQTFGMEYYFYKLYFRSPCMCFSLVFQTRAELPLVRLHLDVPQFFIFALLFHAMINFFLSLGLMYYAVITSSKPHYSFSPELVTVFFRLWTKWIWIGRRVSSPCSTKSVSMNNLDFKTCERYEPPRTV